MDKLMDNHWFLRAIALLFALMLYLVINLDKQSQDSTSLPIGEATETIQNVEVAAYYDQDKYVVSGLPENVDVTLEGSNTTILQTKMKEQYEVFLNLHGYEPGTYEVRLQYNGIPDSLKVQLDPAKVQITIETRKTKSFPVEIGYLNSSQIKSGYVADKATVKPTSIEIAGTEAQLDQVGAVKAYVDLKGVQESFTKEAKIVIYDKSGNTLNLQTTPSTVDVSVSVSSPEKTFSIKAKQQGSVQDGLTVTGVKVEPSEITVYGTKDVLSSIASLDDLAVDVSSMTETTTVETDVPVPKGAVKVSPSKVKVTVQIQQEEQEQQQQLETKAFTDIPITTSGLTDAYELTFLDPSSGKTAVDVTGAADAMAALDSSSITASIDVDGLTEGTHEVTLKLSGPEDVELEPKQEQVQIELVSIEQTDNE